MSVSLPIDLSRHSRKATAEAMKNGEICEACQ